MEWKYDKLRGKIKEMCGTQAVFAGKLGIGRVSLSQRLNNQSEFSQDEIFKSCEILKIDLPEIPTYFFTIYNYHTLPKFKPSLNPKPT